MAGTRPQSQDVGSQSPNASTSIPPRSSLWMTTLRTLRVAELVLAHVPGSALLATGGVGDGTRGPPRATPPASAARAPPSTRSRVGLGIWVLPPGLGLLPRAGCF